MLFLFKTDLVAVGFIVLVFMASSAPFYLNVCESSIACNI